LVLIRTARPTDYRAVEKIDAVIYADHAKERPDLFDPAFTNTISQEAYNNFLGTSDCTVLVAEHDDGNVVGFANIYVEDLSGRVWSPHKKRAEIDSIGVLTEYQGQGVGAALISAANLWAHNKSATYIRLTVHAFNERARAMYEREGFTAERIIMTKDLRAPHV